MSLTGLEIGKIRYKDETHEGEHEAIVPSDLFQRVQMQLKANGQSGGTGVRNKHNALLKGLIWCKACGRPMTHSYSCKANKRYRYNVCGTAMQRGWSECPSPLVPAGEIERFVTDQIINQSELAHYGQISTTRMSQVMWLDNLPPDIQEHTLALPRTVQGRDAILEQDIRPIAKTLDWNEQRKMWIETVRRLQGPPLTE